jgi:hypothetical protein
MRMGNRRAHPRFEVVGSMLGSLLSTERLRVLNVGTSGALVESALPLAANAEYRMQLVLEEGLVGDATVKIRRVHEIRTDAGPARYQIGLEFLAISPEAEEAIAGIVVASQADWSAEV